MNEGETKIIPPTSGSLIERSKEQHRPGLVGPGAYLAAPEAHPAAPKAKAAERNAHTPP